MVAAADAIASFIAPHDRTSFLADYQVQSAVVYQLIVIGEAANHISAAVRARHTHVEWQKAIGLRHYAAHGYFSLDWKIVWDTATGDIPTFQRHVAAVLDAEYPD